MSTKNGIEVPKYASMIGMVNLEICKVNPKISYSNMTGRGIYDAKQMFRLSCSIVKATI